MDLLRYLIAPHERNQQQIPGLSASAPTQAQAHHAVREVSEGSSYSSQSRPASARVPRDSSWAPAHLRPNEILTVNPKSRRSLTQHSPASERAASQNAYQIPAHAPLHPEVLEFSTQCRPSSTAIAAESVPAQVIHPDVLDFLTRHAPASVQTASKVVASNVVPQVTIQVEPSMLSQVPRSEVKYLPPSIVSPHSKDCSSTSSANDKRVRGSSDQSSVTGKLPPVMHTSHKSTKAPNSNKICFFWYHYGDCTRDPNSPTFGGSTNLCRFFHFIDAGMENVGLQKILPKLHKDLGDCQLPRCPRSSNYDMGQYDDSVNNQSKALGETATQTVPLTKVKKNNSGQGGSDSKKPGVQGPQPPLPPPSMDTATPYCKRNRRKKKSTGSNKETPAAGSSFTLAIVPGKRKASEISGEPAQKLLKKKKKQKRKGPIISARYGDKISPPAPPPVVEQRIERRTFAVISATEPEPMPKTAIPTNRKQTCFFWYHGCCSYPGKKCPHLHALTNPPTFVQPPPDYVHREACFRAWCPGDYMWDHLDKRHWHGKDDDDDDEMCLKDDVEIDSAEEDETGPEEDDEWYVSGFPDA